MAGWGPILNEKVHYFFFNPSLSVALFGTKAVSGSELSGRTFNIWYCEEKYSGGSAYIIWWLNLHYLALQ